ncbi:uncharacterized protein LOC144911556 isoform X1 [Branchiostoma floridae x Branchiostoma belcheri]
MTQWNIPNHHWVIDLFKLLEELEQGLTVHSQTGLCAGQRGMDPAGLDPWSSWSVKMEDEKPTPGDLADIGCLSPGAASCLPLSMLQSSQQRFTADIHHLVQEVNFPLRRDSDWTGSSHSSSSQLSVESESSTASAEGPDEPQISTSPRAVHRQRERDRHRSTVIALQEMARLLPVSEDGQKQTKRRVLQQSIHYIDWLHTELKMAYTDLGIEPCTARVSLKDVCRELGVSPAILTMSPSVLSYDLHVLAKHIEGRCLDDQHPGLKLEHDPSGTIGIVDQTAGMAGLDHQHGVQTSHRDPDTHAYTLAGEGMKSEVSTSCHQTENITTPKQSKKRWMSHKEARPRRKTKPKRCCTECLEDSTPRRELGWMGRRLDRSRPFPNARRALFSSEDRSGMETTTVPDDDDSGDRFSAFFQPETSWSEPRSPSPQQVVPSNQANGLDKTDIQWETPTVGSSGTHPPDSVVPEAEEMPYSKPTMDDYIKTSPFGRPASCPPCYSAAMAAPPKSTLTPPIWKNLDEQSIFDTSNSSVDTLPDGIFAGQFPTSWDEADKESNQEVPSEDRDEDGRDSGTRRRRFSYGRAKNKKKCVNGFIMFCKIVREKQKQRYSGYASTQISTMMGRKWAAMSPAERKPFKDAAYEFSLRNNRNVIVQKSLPHDAFDITGALCGTSSASTMDAAGPLCTSSVSSVVSDAHVPVSRECCTATVTSPLSGALGEEAAIVEEVASYMS